MIIKKKYCEKGQKTKRETRGNFYSTRKKYHSGKDGRYSFKTKIAAYI